MAEMVRETRTHSPENQPSRTNRQRSPVLGRFGPGLLSEGIDRAQFASVPVHDRITRTSNALLNENQVDKEHYVGVQNRYITNPQMEQASTTSYFNNTVCVPQINIQEESIIEATSPNPWPRIVENYMIAWVDPNINKFDKDYQHSITQLQSVVNTIVTFTDVAQYIHFLTEINDETVFLIISGALGQQHMPQLQAMPKINFIYVFCSHKWKHMLWAKECRKVRGVFVQIELLCDALKQDIRQCDQDSIQTSILAIDDIQDDNLNTLDQSFLYSHVLKEILLDMKRDDKVKEDLIQFCRAQYVNNEYELKMINEFKQQYDRPSPIWWYTRECFIYKMLNRALRKQDIEIIIKMGFFLQDLHQQIQQLYVESNNQHSIIVYRGQGMSHADFENLTKNTGALYSFNEFLSTSIDKQVALKFTDRPQNNPDQKAILFRMEIDPSVSSVPFASLEHISYFRSEKEILFTMHTVFRIDKVQQIGDNLWQVNLLMASKDNDKQSKPLMDHMRKATKGSTWLHRLGQLMIEMGEFNKAEQVYKMLLETTANNDWQQLAHLHHQVGYILKKKNHLLGTLYHYKESLVIKLKNLPSDDPRLSSTYANIGGVIEQLGDLDGALSYIKYALNIELRTPHPDQLEIATLHNNIGEVLKKQHKYDEALQQYECALNIRLTHLPSHHPSLATVYNNIGSVLNLMNDHTTALSYYQKALKINQKSLPNTHPALALCHHNLAITLKELHRYSDANEHETQAREIAPDTFKFNHHYAQTNQDYFDKYNDKL